MILVGRSVQKMYSMQACNRIKLGLGITKIFGQKVCFIKGGFFFEENSLMECLCPHPLVRPLSTRLGADDEGAELLHANKIKKQFPPVRNYLPILALTMEKTLCGKNQT